MSMTHPSWPHPSHRARWAGKPRARQDAAALGRGGSGGGQKTRLRLWVPASSPPGSGRRPTPGDARRCRLWQTGKSGGADPALRPAPALPSGNSPFSFRPAVAFPRPSGPFKNGTAAASLPARHLAEPPPLSDAAAAGRHVTGDGGRRGSKLIQNARARLLPTL